MDRRFYSLPPHECEKVQSLGDDISRDALEKGATTIYPGQDAKGWFVDTQCGAFTVLAQAENFRSRIIDDWSAGEPMQAEIETWLDAALTDYAKKMCLTQMKRARLKLRRKPRWFEHYKELDSFRTSLPSQEVWDVREKENERDWSYDADVKMLLTRAERLWYNKRHDRLYVKGYGKYRQVWFAKTFDDEHEDECCGILRTTGDYSEEDMQFIQEGHLTSVSHVMAKQKYKERITGHLFVLVPEYLRHKLDWRIAWFRCGSRGKYIIAFDGDALLLKEIYDQVSK